MTNAYSEPAVTGAAAPAPSPNDGLWNASLSTMWAGSQFAALGDFFAAARRLGFRGIELNYKVRSDMLAGLDLKQVHFSSIHEPCPADIPSQTLKERDWLISSPDEENRRQGVAAVRRSIDLASELGAPVVVVHAGAVQKSIGAEIFLRALIHFGYRGSGLYRKIQEKLARERAAQAGPRLEAVKKSLLELLDYAGRSGVRLGIENRDHYMEIPLLDEMEMLLALAEPDRLGVIFDVGHAESLDRLGFARRIDWLERYAPRIFGAHLHDMIGLRDHHAPGLGEIDFRQIAPYLPAGAFRTCELRPTNTPEQVQAGLRHLADAGCVLR